MKSVLMIFVDGIGIGDDDPVKNPFFKYGFKTFTEIFGKVPHTNSSFLTADEIILKPVDANLNVEGLPQSGTGQVSIFCGVNAPKIVGKHFGPFPHSTTIPYIKKQNIFIDFIKKNKKVFFANAYPKVFFDYLKQGKSRLSTTTSCYLGAGLKLNSVSDVRKGRALTAEITNERWNKKLGYNLRVISPEGAARRLLKISSQNHFTLYEFFLTDHLGHGRINDEFENVYNNIDRFLFTILTSFKRYGVNVVICSDHGNFEDLSIKTHTRNPALFITAGKYSRQISGKIKNISQIKSAILNVFE